METHNTLAILQVQFQTHLTQKCLPNLLEIDLLRGKV